MNYTGLGIHLKVRDITASRDFYEGVLGLTPVRASGSDGFRRTLAGRLPATADGLPGSPDLWNSVTYQPASDATLEISDGHPAVPSRGVFAEPVRGPKVSAMLHTESLVPLVQSHGPPAHPVRVYPWGTVELVLKDPDDFVVVVIAPATEGELRRLTELVTVEAPEP